MRTAILPAPPCFAQVLSRWAESLRFEVTRVILEASQIFPLLNPEGYNTSRLIVRVSVAEKTPGHLTAFGLSYDPPEIVYTHLPSMKDVIEGYHEKCRAMQEQGVRGCTVALYVCWPKKSREPVHYRQVKVSQPRLYR